MAPYFKIKHGDATEVLRTMPDECVDCTVISPPYFGQRDYEGQEGQLGQEEKPEEYTEKMSAIGKEIYRVSKPTATFFLNIGDTSATGSGIGSHSGLTEKRRGKKLFVIMSEDGQSTSRGTRRRKPTKSDIWTLKHKDFLMIPALVAIRLRQDGWTLRRPITWCKPCCTPGGNATKDCCEDSTEMIYMFSKSKKYYSDKEGLKELMRQWAVTHPTHQELPGGNHWIIAPGRFDGAHYAVFPNEIPRRCITMGCPIGGVVLDCFSGMATTGIEANKLGRNYIGIELCKDYIEMSLERYIKEMKRYAEQKRRIIVA